MMMLSDEMRRCAESKGPKSKKLQKKDFFDSEDSDKKKTKRERERDRVWGIKMKEMKSSRVRQGMFQMCNFSISYG